MGVLVVVAHMKYTTQEKDMSGRSLMMMTLNLPKKQVNAILVALDTEIDYLFDTHGRPDWETFPELAAMLMAYYTTRCKFDEDDCR